MTVQGADQGDTTTIAETVTAAAEELEAVAVATDGETAVIDEVVADKGYHSNQVLVDLAALDLRTYIAEPDRGRRNWKQKAGGPRPEVVRVRASLGRHLARPRPPHTPGRQVWSSIPGSSSSSGCSCATRDEILHAVRDLLDTQPMLPE